MLLNNPCKDQFSSARTYVLVYISEGTVCTIRTMSVHNTLFKLTYFLRKAKIHNLINKNSVPKYMINYIYNIFELKKCLLIVFRAEITLVLNRSKSKEVQIALKLLLTCHINSFMPVIIISQEQK